MRCQHARSQRTAHISDGIAAIMVNPRIKSITTSVTSTGGYYLTKIEGSLPARQHPRSLCMHLSMKARAPILIKQWDVQWLELLWCVLEETCIWRPRHSQFTVEKHFPCPELVQYSLSKNSLRVLDLSPCVHIWKICCANSN